MHFRLWQWLTLVVFSLFVLPASGAQYEITTTADTDDRSECSIRNALEAIKTRQAVGACEAADENNSILLREGATYSVNSPDLLVARENSDGDRVATTVRFGIAGDFEDDENPDNATLDANGDSRVFTVAKNARLRLANMTLRNGDVTSGADGGLIRAGQASGVTITAKSRLENGRADRGGLIYANGATIEVLEESALKGGRATMNGGAMYLASSSSLNMNTASIESNASEGSGGGIAIRKNFNGQLSLRNAYLAENEASNGEGGGLYLPDLGSNGGLATLVIRNTTIAGNSSSGSGAAVYWEQQESTGGSQAISINNMTVANNSSGSGGSVEVSEGVNPAGDATVQLVNSVIVGDQGAGDCAAGGAFSEDMIKRYNVLGDGCSPGSGIDNTDADDGQDSIKALANEEGQCSSGGCEPADFSPFPGYLPATAPGISCNNTTFPTAFCAGNPPGQGGFACESSDQRGVSRLEEERCDAGSIQFQTAVGEVDEIEIVSGEVSELDFVQNDLGDANVDCGAVGGVDNCIEKVFPPDRPEASIEFVEDPDQPGSGYPVAVYDPGSNYHGLDRFAYSIESAAFEATRQGRDVEAVVNVVAQPESGLQESDSIEQLGAVPWLGLAVIGLLGIIRRRALSAVLLLAMAPISQGAEITVDAMHDRTDRNDGVCTLREAIQSSRDDTVNPEPACADGADGEDTVILPRGCITLDPGKGPLQVDDQITIRGEGPHGIASDAPLAGNVCDSDSADWTTGTILRVGNGGSTRILQNSAGTTISGMTLFGGRALGRNGGAIRASANLSLEEVEFFRNEATETGGTGGRGGAIWLVGLDDADDPQQLSVLNGYFLNNSADRDGGAITMQSGTGFSLEISDSTFEGNEAEGGAGGALGMIGNTGASWIVNTTLIDNTATDGAGAIDLQELAAGGASSGTPSVSMVNNTIVDNENSAGGPGGINVGPAKDGSGNDREREFRLTNSILASNSNNRCYSSSSEAEPFNELIYNLISSNNDDGSGDTCFSNNQQSNNTFRGDSDIRNSLINQTAYTEGEGADGFVPPNLEVKLGAPATAEIEDAGNDAELAAGSTDDPSRCRPGDVRGFTRESGTQCDRGAFEIQETTAINDTGSGEVLREDGKIFIDVLANDFTDPASRRIDPTSLQIVSEAANLPGGTAVVYKDFRSVECVGHDNVSQEVRDRNPDVDFDEEDCVILYDPALADPLDGNGGSQKLACGDLPREYQEDSLGAAFEYSFEAVDLNDDTDRDAPGDPGKVFLTVENIAPEIESETVRNEPGDKVVLELDIGDPFAPEGEPKIDYSSFELESAPEFADVSENGDIVGTGIKFNEPRQGQITYVPRDNTKSFTDRFQVSVEDKCEKRSNAASMVIRYPDEDISGGEALGGGYIGPAALIALAGLGGVRRRFRAGAPLRR